MHHSAITDKKFLCIYVTAFQCCITYENDHDGVALNYEAVGRAVRGVTKSRACSVELDDTWASDIAEYHDKAGKGRWTV